MEYDKMTKKEFRFYFPDHVEIIVIGDRGCGKTTFIEAFCKYAKDVQTYSQDGETVFLCNFELNGMCRNLLIVEFAGNFDNFLEYRRRPYGSPEIFIFMFALPDEKTLNKLRNIWLPAATEYVARYLPLVALVANKKDIGNNVGDPVPFDEICGNLSRLCLRVNRELSSIDDGDVVNTFVAIFEAAKLFEKYQWVPYPYPID